MTLRTGVIFSFTIVALIIIDFPLSSAFKQILPKLTDVIIVFTSTEKIYYCAMHEN